MAVRPDAPRLIVVLDTNALVRVALAKSPPARSLRLAFERGDFILLVSEEILIELGRVLRYERIAARYALTEVVITEFEQAIRTTAVVVPGLYLVSKIEADPSDDKFLAPGWSRRSAALPGRRAQVQWLREP